MLLPAALVGLAVTRPAAAKPETWTPEGGIVPVGGFVVDLQNRMESLAFYNAAYLASEGAAARIGWTGVLASCNIGTTAPAFREDVRRRVNYYRALCGLPSVSFDAEPALNVQDPVKPQVAAVSTKRTCAQAAAHLNAYSNVFFSPYNPTHDPTAANTACWSAFAWNGSQQSNLTIGFFGPKAVNVYMADDDLTDDRSNNVNVGHRRWILHSRARDMSTGDVPPGVYTDLSGSYPVLPANALYVIGQLEPAATAPRQFVSWPPAGYVPAPLMPLRWSLSFPDATFPSAPAAISLTGPTGNPIPVTVLSHNVTDQGDNSVVFQPPPLPAPGTADTTYRVTVTGMGGPGVPSSYSWETTFFDPDVLGVPLTLQGPGQPPASGADYQASAVPLAEGWEVQAGTLGAAAAYLENADGASPLITSDRTGSYPILQGPGSLDGIAFAPRSGTRSFHLCFPPDSSEIDYLPHSQSFALDASFVPAADSILTFHELFRWLFTVNRLSVELSADGGRRWTEIYGRDGSYVYTPGPNYTSGLWDTAWRARSIPLAAWAGQVIQLRFILRPGSVSFDGPDLNHGCYLDDITLTNVQRFLPSPARQFPDRTFRFDSTLTGGPLVAGTPWLLRARPRIGTRFMGYSGPRIIVPLPPTGFESAWPALAARPAGDDDADGIPNLVEYAFDLNPTGHTPGGRLPQPVREGNQLILDFIPPGNRPDLTYAAECSADLIRWEPVPNTGAGNQRRFAIPLTPGENCLIRLRVTQQPGMAVAP